MRLSHAILLGQPLIAKPAPATLWSCAFGMALAAIGKPVPIGCADERELQGYEDFRQQWPWLRQTKLGSPCGCYDLRDEREPVDVIIHLFDWHVMRDGTWTLEQLADYVRSIEPAEPGETVQESVAFTGTEQRSEAMVMAGDGPTQVTERAELLKV